MATFSRCCASTSRSVDVSVFSPRTRATSSSSDNSAILEIFMPRSTSRLTFSKRFKSSPEYVRMFVADLEGLNNSYRCSQARMVCALTPVRFSKSLMENSCFT